MDKIEIGPGFFDRVEYAYVTENINAMAQRTQKLEDVSMQMAQDLSRLNRAMRIVTEELFKLKAEDRAVKRKVEEIVVDESQQSNKSMKWIEKKHEAEKLLVQNFGKSWDVGSVASALNALNKLMECVESARENKWSTYVWNGKEDMWIFADPNLYYYQACYLLPKIGNIFERLGLVRGIKVFREDENMRVTLYI